MDDRTLATRAIALRILRDLVDEAMADTKAALEASLLPGDRVQAVVYPVGEEPADVGMVYRSKPTGSPAEAYVQDPAAFLAWAEAVYPEEVLVRREVDVTPALVEWLAEHAPGFVRETRYANPPWLTSLLKDAAGAGVEHVGASTGEVLPGPPPGVAVRPPGKGRSTTTVKPGAEARDVVLGALRSGALRPADVVPALEPAPAPAPR